MICKIIFWDISTSHVHFYYRNCVWLFKEVVFFASSFADRYFFQFCEFCQICNLQFRLNDDFSIVKIDFYLNDHQHLFYVLRMELFVMTKGPTGRWNPPLITFGSKTLVTYMQSAQFDVNQIFQSLFATLDTNLSI